MKLYFYILETNKDGKPYFKVKECEAFEKLGAIRPKDGKFPCGKVRTFITREEIGKLQNGAWGYVLPYIILEKPDISKVKQIYIEQYIDVTIERCKNKIAEFEEKRKAIEEAKEQIM